jgi:hypothetical protein
VPRVNKRPLTESGASWNLSDSAMLKVKGFPAQVNWRSIQRSGVPSSVIYVEFQVII